MKESEPEAQRVQAADPETHSKLAKESERRNQSLGCILDKDKLIKGQGVLGDRALSPTFSLLSLSSGCRHNLEVRPEQPLITMALI